MFLTVKPMFLKICRCCVALFLLPEVVVLAAELGQLEQQAYITAVQRVESSVVQISTVGGLDRIGDTLLAQGPTSGMVISEDGYIVSSAVNFAQQPTSILVRLPDGSQLPANLVAHDKNRMLVLLKVEPDSPLEVPEAVPTDELRAGQWAIAVGAAFEDKGANLSVGIISALQRMYGRVVQTDASVSVANYGGPLIDIHGRVIGILVPMAPNPSGGETNALAGVEFYDSGIGFAVPLEHVLEILPRWKEGDDLLPGKLGIGLTPGEAHLQAAEIRSVWPNSPAADAGWKAEDQIAAVDGQPIHSQADLRFAITPRYAGDTLKVTIERGDEQIDTELTLAGQLEEFRHAFLGILPELKTQEESEEGVAIRAVWPDTPAAEAGIQPGDRITSIGEEKTAGVSEAIGAISSLSAGESVEVKFSRDEAQHTEAVATIEFPEAVLSTEALGELKIDAAPEFQAEELMVPPMLEPTKYYAPEPTSASPGLVLWLDHDGPENNAEQVEAWKSFCLSQNMILILAQPTDESGWSSDDLEQLARLREFAAMKLGIDPLRSIVAGREKAGQMALALAMRQRGKFAGVAAIDAPLPRTLEIPSNHPSLRLALLFVESSDSSLTPLVRRDVERLREAGYPTSRETFAREKLSGDKLDSEPMDFVGRWIAGLYRF